MRCPLCDGKGEHDHRSENLCGSYVCMIHCETCDGTGAVIEKSEWIPKWSRTCSSCQGSGKTEEQYVTEYYPSGNPAKYGKRKITCYYCKGQGKETGGGGYNTWYVPDYNARKGGSGCFITTACLAANSVPEAEQVLGLLRSFRDEYVRSSPGGGKLVSDYYQIAPKIVKAIDASPNSDRIYRELYARLVIRSVNLINDGARREALDHYRTIMLELRHTFLPMPLWSDGAGI